MITTRDLYISTIKILAVDCQSEIHSIWLCRSNAATCRSSFFLKTSIRVSTDTIFRWSIVKRVKQYQTKERDPSTVYDDGWLPVYW